MFQVTSEMYAISIVSSLAAGELIGAILLFPGFLRYVKIKST
jgi:hypothetical protein